MRLHRCLLVLFIPFSLLLLTKTTLFRCISFFYSHVTRWVVSLIYCTETELLLSSTWTSDSFSLTLNAINFPTTIFVSSIENFPNHVAGVLHAHVPLRDSFIFLARRQNNRVVSSPTLPEEENHCKTTKPSGNCSCVFLSYSILDYVSLHLYTFSILFSSFSSCSYMWFFI